MRRITIDEVRAACEKTGYRLVPHITLSALRKCGCPIGIITMVQSGDSRDPSFSDLSYLDSSYRLGFITGFDKTRCIVPIVDIKTYDIGHSDGLAIRQALLPTAAQD